MTITVRKKILNIGGEPIYTSGIREENLIQLFESKDWKNDYVEEIEIELKSFEPKIKKTIKNKLFFSSRPYSSPSLGQIQQKEIARIYIEILSLLRSPERVAKHLKSLDDEIGKKIATLEYSQEDLPQYLIPARGYLVAGPPPENYKVRNQGRSLDEELLKREKQHGINLEGTPKFVGFVQEELANRFVSEGHLFAEDVQVDNLLLHAKYSHRLQNEIIRNAIEAEDLNLPIGEKGEKMNYKELLTLLIKNTLQKNGLPCHNLWASLFDGIMDSHLADHEFYRTEYENRIPSKELFGVKKFLYSSRSPWVFNSLITCFGADLGLPNLQHYLLNSHWKEAAQMVEKARGLSREIDLNSKAELGETTASCDAGFSSLYTNCMKSLILSGYDGSIIKSPLTTSGEDAAKSKKYELYPSLNSSDCNGIKIKLEPSKNSLSKTGLSFDEYAREKINKTKSVNVKIPNSANTLESDKILDSTTLNNSENPVTNPTPIDSNPNRLISQEKYFSNLSDKNSR